MLRSRTQTRRRFAGALAIFLALLTATSARAWQTAHGKPDNSGAVDVDTAPAVTPLPNAPRLGGVAPGAGPVIAPDGTVYVVNGRGKLMSFQPDGTPGWSRDIANQGVLSSPALGSDGSIYIIGAATIRDKTTNPPTTKHIAELHKFTASGGYVWHVPLPGAAGRLTTSAPPNIWRAGGADVVMVPTIRKFGGFEARLTAFSSDTGAVLAHQVVTTFVPETTGGSDLEWWDWHCHLIIQRSCEGGFDSPQVPASEPAQALPGKQQDPFPAVAIFTPMASGAPLVLMSDGFHDLVGYSFTGNAFEERFRVRDDKRVLLSTPLAWPDGHAMISTGGYQLASDVMFAGLNMATIRAAGPLSWAAPTALGNSRFAIVHRFGGVTFLRGASTEKTVTLPGHSIASAAASRNHVFVSTVGALHTFDKATMSEIAKFEWQRGGASPVAIGPQGHVYAIADDRLFVFSPLGSGGGIFQDGDIPPPRTAQSQTYKPPLTPNSNRLFACEELDGDDCGKGDYRSIAKAFCSKQGFVEADDIKVDSKKVKAETLDGRFCSKNKCKVFDRITCKM